MKQIPTFIIQKHVYKHLLEIWKNKHQNASSTFFFFFRVISLLEFLLHFYFCYIVIMSKIFVYCDHILLS